MVLNDERDPAESMLYTLEFTARPPGRAVFLDQPRFDGQPVPSQYAGKDPQELTNLTTALTNAVWLTNAAYSAVDDSPELRRHPELNKLVSDLRNDPLV